MATTLAEMLLPGIYLGLRKGFELIQFGRAKEIQAIAVMLMLGLAMAKERGIPPKRYI